MSILVIGGGGYVGSLLVKKLVEKKNQRFGARSFYLRST